MSLLYVKTQPNYLLLSIPKGSKLSENTGGNLKTKSNFIYFLFTAVLLGVFSARAQAPSSSPSHDGHHSEIEAGEAKSEKSNMMEKMDMSQMKGMMHECMEMHKDGKMCEHQTMEKCQQKMGKGECGNMMKGVKKEENKVKSKK